MGACRFNYVNRFIDSLKHAAQPSDGAIEDIKLVG
jgi:hypothetical protein